MMKNLFRRCGFAAVAMTVALGAAPIASAATVTFFGSQSPAGAGQFTYDPNDDRAQLICSLGCDGLLSTQGAGTFPNSAPVPDISTANGFSGSAADLFDLANSSAATELAFVNSVVDPDFASGTKTDVNLNSFTFVSSAAYILFKIGATPDYALIRNLFAGNTFDFSAFAGEGAGLSHITEYGTVSGVIPLPAALPLFLTAFGGLAFFGWRRRSGAARA
jgi:hypothetical protein